MGRARLQTTSKGRRAPGLHMTAQPCNSEARAHNISHLHHHTTRVDWKMSSVGKMAAKSSTLGETVRLHRHTLRIQLNVKYPVEIQCI